MVIWFAYGVCLVDLVGCVIFGDSTYVLFGFVLLVLVAVLLLGLRLFRFVFVDYLGACVA